MRLKPDKTMIVGFSLIFICGLIGVLSWGWFREYYICNFEVYAPAKSFNRFIEIVLEAHKNHDYAMLQQLATEDAISSLDAFPNLSSQPIDVLPLDYLKDTEYNNRVFYDDTHYFDVWLEYEAWPECPDDEFTDEEVMAHFRLLRVGNYNEP